MGDLPRTPPLRRLTPAQQRRLHFRLHVSRIIRGLQRHLRRHPAVVAHGAEAFRALSATELTRTEQDRLLEPWGVPGREEIEAKLRSIDARLDNLMATLSDSQRQALPLEGVRQRFALDEDDFHLLLVAALPCLSERLTRMLGLLALGPRPSVHLCANVVARDSDHLEHLLARLTPQGRLGSQGVLAFWDDPRWGAQTPIHHRILCVDDALLGALRPDPV